MLLLVMKEEARGFRVLLTPEIRSGFSLGSGEQRPQPSSQTFQSI